MAEYIDREKLYDDIEENSSAYYSEEVEIKNECLSRISYAETADVVPRSEVEKAKQEVAEWVIAELKKCLKIRIYNVRELIAKLEKKYIGG